MSFNQGDKPYLWKKPPLNLGGSSFELRKLDKNFDPSPDFSRVKVRSRAHSDGGLNKIQEKFDRQSALNLLERNETSLKLPRHNLQKEIEFEGELPKSGTMSAIVNWLIFNSDKQIIQKFLVRYNQFETEENLFQFLQEKYRETEHNPEKAEKVLSFLLIWIERYFTRDFQRTGCLEALESFLQNIKAGEHTSLVRKIKLCLVKQAGHVPISQVFVNSLPMLTPSKSKRSRRSSRKIQYINNEPIHFSSISPEDFAEQLTLIESELFREVQESDLLEKVWLSKNPPKNNPLCLMIDLFNRISIWCASEIVAVQDLKERVNVLRKFISIADHCYELKNFNALMALTAGMNLSAVQRLEKTWALVGNSYKSSFDKYTNLMSTKQNFQNYRNLLNNTKLPIVPYIGVFFRDLTFIEEGNSDYLESGLVNFDKLILIGNLIVEIRSYQQSVYDIQMNSSILSFFDHIVAPSEEEVYLMSTKIEEDETSPE